ncbi:MAG: DUF4276 family protein, partial [Pirellulaceae bacterium]
MSDADGNEWKFFRFGLIVTGKAEEAFLPNLFRSLAATGHCSFQVIRRIGQRSAITSEKRKARMVGTGQLIPDKDAREIGFPARRYLTAPATFVILVDDLEADRKSHSQAIFQRYRDALNQILGEQRHRASVHFLVNMLEAYYFADANAINAVLGTNLGDYESDVETIRHPKNELKKRCASFDEIEHGKEIVAKLHVQHVLSRRETCASLRTLFGWCSKAIGQTPTDGFDLARGSYSELTEKQIH